MTSSDMSFHPPTSAPVRRSSPANCSVVEAVPAHYSARNVAIAAVLTEITKRPFGRKHISTKVQSSKLRAGTATSESLLDGWITDGD